MLRPLNDYALVELIDEYKNSGLEIAKGEYDGAEKGKVIEVGKSNYMSTNAWVHDVKNTVEAFDGLIGKIIYWEKFTDNNATVEYDGKKYAFIKLAKITGYEE